MYRAFTLNGPRSTVRVDPAPGFVSLAGDQTIQDAGINIEMGRIKNINKNPVAEKAIAELEEEIVRLNPSGEPVTAMVLLNATARLNSRIRNRGLSARELLFQRDQFTHDQIPLSDLDMILKQHS